MKITKQELKNIINECLNEVVNEHVALQKQRHISKDQNIKNHTKPPQPLRKIK